jgi:NitT/TauT family transport system substrate-binding protein
MSLINSSDTTEGPTAVVQCQLNNMRSNPEPLETAAAVRAIVRTQRVLKADPSLATRVATRLFPAEEASLIGDLVARDAPFYDANISPGAVDGLNRFAKANGLISEPVPYDQLVAPPFIRQLWNE